VELLAAIEDRYQVSLDESTFTAATTVADLERLLGGEAEPATAGATVGHVIAKTEEAQPKPRATFHYPRWAQRWLMQIMRVAVYYLLSWPATILLALPRMEGRENLRGVRGPVLLISNHVTYLDAGLLLYALPPRLRHRTAVAMSGEMLNETRYPPRELNWFLRLVSKTVFWLMTGLFNVFPLPQRAGFRESFAFAGESVDRGYSVLVFPEGARTPDGKIAAFRGGVGLLTKNLRLPVVPMRIDGLWEIKKTGRRGSAPWRSITLRIGKPVTPAADAEPERIARELEEAVRSL
jgi:long-chain acyl-CoA synthetase